MAKKRSYRRRYRKIRHRVSHMTIPIAPMAGILAMPAVGQIWANVAVGHWGALPDNFKQMIGIDPNTGSIDSGLLVKNWVPPLAGILIHKFVGGKLGINAALAKAKVPFLRV